LTFVRVPAKWSPVCRQGHAPTAKVRLPIQTATNLLAYEAGYYGAADVRRLGLAMLALTMLVVMLTIPYWGWLGLHFTRI
jgi:hypothetical protein